MKDYLDNELSIGNEIVACVGHGKNAGASLVKGKVTGFTKEYVKVEIPWYSGSPKPEERKISARKVLKIINGSVSERSKESDS